MSKFFFEGKYKMSEIKKLSRRVILDRRVCPERRKKSGKNVNAHRRSKYDRRLFDRRNFNPKNAKLGAILIWKKFITKNQLFEALDKQIEWKLKLGETLIKLGYLNQKKLQEALDIQSFEDKFKKFDTDK